MIGLSGRLEEIRDAFFVLKIKTLNQVKGVWHES